MTERYLCVGETAILFDTESYQIFMSVGDKWVEISDPDIRKTIRLNAMEISGSAPPEKSRRHPGTHRPAHS